MSQEQQEQGTTRSGRLLRWGVPAVLVLGAAYGGTAYAVTRTAPAKTTVGGVAIGGMDQDQARAALQAKAAELAAKPVTLTAAGKQATLTPKDAGLSIDVDASLSGLTNTSFNPSKIVNHFTGGSEHDFVAAADSTALTAAVTKAAASLDSKPVDGTFSLAGGVLKAGKAVTGSAVDAEATADAITATWPAQATVAAVTETVEPKTTQAEIDTAVKEFGTPLTSGPITVTNGTATGTLSPAQLAQATTVALDQDGAPKVTVDDAKLAALIGSQVKGMVVAPVDATVKLVNGVPTPVDGKEGSAVVPAGLGGKLLDAARSGGRTLTVTTQTAKPKVDLAAVKGWGIKELIADYTAELSYNPPRTSNIRIAANTINGTIIKPGEMFSLNGILGERTAEKGYREATIISGARYEKGRGGGVSQVSTSTLNAAFFGGMTLIEHRAHSFYITHYPEGREATVSWPTLDNKWRNDTKYAVLVEPWVDGQLLHYRLWSTKTWDDIEAVKGPRRKIVPPRTIYDASSGCVPQVPVPGFSVDITRQFIKGGAVVKTDGFTTDYVPQNKVVCGPKPSAASSSGTSSSR